MRFRSVSTWLTVCAGLSFIRGAEASPVPIGQSQITLRYMTENGPVEFSDAREYTGGPPVDLDGNVKMFNSAGNTATAFGRRTSLLANPIYANVLGPNETLVAHAFFKQDNDADYFPGIMHDSDITVRIENVQFAEPVTIQQDTMLFHTLWLSEQSDQLDDFYHHVHNIHTLTDPFRNADEFLAAGQFATSPDNFVIEQSAISYSILGDGTDTLSFEFTFPYALMMNLEEMHHQNPEIPVGLPAPHGFLEPFHFHFEYAVVPEPGTILLLLSGGAGAAMMRNACGRRRR